MIARVRLLTLAALASACALGAAEGERPEAWRAWQDKRYTVRYFLTVLATPKAGSIQLQPEPNVATAILPLVLRKDPLADGGKGAMVPERVLAVDENGQTVPILIRPVEGGNEVQVAFPTHETARRLCLYAGAEPGSEPASSPQTYLPRAIRVRALAQEAPGSFQPTPANPVTLDHFKNLSPNAGRLDHQLRPNIDDPEPFVPPYTSDPDRRTPALGDVKQYVASYEGFLRAPLSGEYEFAVATFGAAFLVINEKLRIEAGAPDPQRATFALKGRTKLAAGMHRVVLYHAQAGEKTGVRLFWRPPGAEDFLAVPAQSFPRGLPAQVADVEFHPNAGDPSHARIDLELLGQVRTRGHRGPEQATEWIWVFARAFGQEAAKDRCVRLAAPGRPPVLVPAGGGCAWLPAGVEIAAQVCERDGRACGLPERRFLFPTEANGARDVAILPAELEIKAAPQFLYPDETGQVHLETQLKPLPTITPKERVERGPALPEPVPLGQFRLRWRLGAGGKTWSEGSVDATPEVAGRKKLRVPLDTKDLEARAKEGTARLELELSAGGVPVEGTVFRLLHSRAAWPAGLRAQPDGLAWQTGGGAPERVAIVLPREDEAEYRRFKPLGLEGLGGKTERALFAGDPLVETGAPHDPAQPAGLAAKLAAALPELTWSHAVLPGPQRGRFVYRLIAETEACLAKLDESARPQAAVIGLGSGDAAGQTPLHDFERGLDVLIDRLRRAGVRRIVFLGVLPEPGRADQARPYHQRWQELERQHHLEGVDLFTRWTKEANWARRFAVDPESSSPVYRPVPGDAALDEIVELLKGKVR